MPLLSTHRRISSLLNSLTAGALTAGALTVGALAIFGGGCGSPGAGGGTTPDEIHFSPDAPSMQQAQASFASANNQLGVDIWQALREPGQAVNMAISPLSISTALTMTYGGATGSTETAMANVLHVSGGPDQAMVIAGAAVRAYNEADSPYELAIANRLFGEATYGFRDSFIAASGQHFGAQLQEMDFRRQPDASRLRINGWVEAQTHERIRELLPSASIDSLTRLVLVNAVYFHGSWAREFDSARTQDLPFYMNGDLSASVPTMQATGGRYGQVDGAQVVELPYTGDDLSMLLVLPAERDGLSALEQGMTAEGIDAWAAATTETANLQIKLPRFRIETDSISLKPALQALGMGVAFGDDASFGGISEPSADPLQISDVFHRVFVEVNEEGTEAAAATAVVMQVRSYAGPRPTPPRFVADHPFLFFLRDTRSGVILFAGRVVDPRS